MPIISNPGKYIFHVKGSNNDGIWNENDVALHINILPPWSKTWWFRLALVLFLIGLLALTYFLRLTFYKSQQQKLLVLVRERTFQLEEVAVTLEEKQEEINSQNEKLMSQRDELENHFKILAEQQKQILEQNRELDLHRNRLESLVEERTRELIQAKNRAEESDRLKSSFLANLSHEIRTPLNAILGFSSLLGEKNLNDDEREEYNRIIQGSSNTLLDLISDILDISKIEAGQLELNLQAVSLETVVSDVVEIFDLFMKRDDIGSNKPVELKVAIDDNLRKFFIIADSVRLTQILSNLINNAIKFTRQGFIEVGCSKIRDEETLEFYVKDTGIGIKIEHQQLVFERFRKVEEDKMQLHRGTGLGLAISYQLVNLMGGTMRLESAFGKGSVFYFTIPLIRTTSPGIPVRKKRGKLTAPDFSNLKILVAEDDISNFNYIEKLLRKAKADVLHAEDGGKVLSIMKSNPDVRLILMDIKMPVMDGIETLHALRAQNIQIPVIAQTAYALADEIIRLKTEGFDEYLSKPIQRENLYAIIAKVTHIDIQ
jgi:signal transduction histidine kinase/CheY-like chemotaxis protein